MEHELITAIQKNNTAKVQELIQNNPDINVNIHDIIHGRTALHSAIMHKNIVIIKLLLDHPKIDVNATDNEGWTALHFASMDDDCNITNLLLAKPNINVNQNTDQKTNSGFTAFALTCVWDCFETAKLLINYRGTFTGTITEQSKQLHIALYEEKQTYFALLPYDLLINMLPCYQATYTIPDQIINSMLALPEVSKKMKAIIRIELAKRNKKYSTSTAGKKIKELIYHKNILHIVENQSYCSIS